MRYDGNIDYIEEREFIKERMRKQRRFKRGRFPNDLREQIRYYYRKYLKKLDREYVEILSSDTSLEINENLEVSYRKPAKKLVFDMHKKNC